MLALREVTWRDRGGKKIYTPRAPRRREKIPVTVCVAAICEKDIIIGASDRMLTSGDIQFEPPQPKIWRITDSIAIMTAGDSPIQTSIIEGLARKVFEKYGADPKAVVPVKEVADLYSQFHGEEQSKEAARRYLAPFNLDLESFVARQQELSPEFVRQVGNNMTNYTLPDVEAIVAGVDYLGAHLYQIFNGEVTCQNGVGFVAIGAGGWHANSQFMFAGHTRFKLLPETLFLTYSAKKRAEVAPGVGSVTDMFFIGPDIGTYLTIRMPMIDRLEAVYQSVVQRETGTRYTAIREVEEYVEEVVRQQEAARAAAEAQNAASDGGGGHKPDDEAKVRGRSEEGEPEGGDSVH